MTKESLSIVYAVFKGFSFVIEVWVQEALDVAVDVYFAKDYN